MHFDPNGKASGLPYNPLKALIAPRPIGWISSLSGEGVANLAPYSFFNMVSDSPAMLIFATAGHKDSFHNVQATGEFVWNLVTAELIDAMNVSSGPHAPDIDEFEAAGLAKAASQKVAPPRVAAALAALECRVHSIIPLPSNIEGQENSMVMGEVVSAYIQDDALVDGMFDTARAQPVSRLGYKDYAVVRETFTLDRPG